MVGVGDADINIEDELGDITEGKATVKELDIEVGLEDTEVVVGVDDTFPVEVCSDEDVCIFDATELEGVDGDA